MKKLSLAAAALALAALSACHKNNPEQLGNNVETSADNLNALSDQAAQVASQAQQLENQATQLNQQVANTTNAMGPQSASDENIAGM